MAQVNLENIPIKINAARVTLAWVGITVLFVKVEMQAVKNVGNKVSNSESNKRYANSQATQSRASWSNS